MPRTIDRDARKAQLAEAVWHVIREQGIAAVSVRTVAEHAGVAVGSLRHVFPTRSELVCFSAELMLRRATERVRAVPPSRDRPAYVTAVLAELLPLTPDSRAEMEINLALLAEGTAVPGIVEVRDEAHAQLASFFVRLVGSLTGEDADAEAIEREARRLHAIVDGLAFHLLHQPANADGSWALDIVRREVDAMASGSDRET